MKEGLYHYKSRLGKKLNSTALIADAWHHRSDSLSSVAALIGVGLSILGEKLHLSYFIYGDAVAGIVVSIIVMKVGYDLIKASATVILEKVLSKEEIQHYKETVFKIDRVKRIDQLFARTHGSYIIIDIKISVDQHITVKEGHDIAREVKTILMDSHVEIEDVLVHINPYFDNEDDTNN